MIIRNFKLTENSQVDEYVIVNLTSEDGKDWYESQGLFKPDYLKFEFDKNGVIRRLSMDVSMLWPVDSSVAEINPSMAPEGLNEGGGWMFDGEKITTIPVNYAEEAKQEKSRRLEDAMATIAPLQDAVDLGMATDEETASLHAWKKYRVLLNRIDTTTAPDIEWPVTPG